MKATGFKIPVSDIAKATNFYHKKLGFHIDFEAPQYGWATVSKDGFVVGLYVPGMGGGTRQPGGSVDFSLTTTDLEQLHQAYATVERTTDIVTTNDGQKLFDIEDEDGNVITFRQEVPC